MTFKKSMQFKIPRISHSHIHTHGAHKAAARPKLTATLAWAEQLRRALLHSHILNVATHSLVLTLTQPQLGAVLVVVLNLNYTWRPCMSFRLACGAAGHGDAIRRQCTGFRQPAINARASHPTTHPAHSPLGTLATSHSHLQ